MKYIITIKSIV